MALISNSFYPPGSIILTTTTYVCIYVWGLSHRSTSLPVSFRYSKRLRIWGCLLAKQKIRKTGYWLKGGTTMKLRGLRCGSCENNPLLGYSKHPRAAFMISPTEILTAKRTGDFCPQAVLYDTEGGTEGITIPFLRWHAHSVIWFTGFKQDQRGYPPESWMQRQ